MRGSIARRMILWLIAPLALLSVLWAFTTYFFYIAPKVAESERRLFAASQVVVGRLQHRDEDVQLPEMPGDDRSLLIDERIGYLAVDSQGRVVAGNPRLLALSSAARRESNGIERLDGHEMRFLARQIETPKGLATVIVAETAAATPQDVTLSLLGVFLVEFTRLDVTLVLVWMAIRRGLKPVQRLREEICSRSPHDLSPLPEAASPSELAPLTAALNTFFSRVGSVVHSQERFVANVAHQLRTPLAGINAQLGLLINAPEASQVKPKMAVLQNGIRQLIHSTNQLLTLARVDAMMIRRAHVTSIDLQVLIGEVISKFADRAIAAGIELAADMHPAYVIADPGLLDDMLSNLVDNAVKYTPPGGVIVITAGMENEFPFLEVDDNGVGIPEAERDRVRTRFYRVPGAPGPGSGLGLAIVDEIARQCGAVVTIDTGRARRGTRVNVRFPAIRAAKRFDQ